MKGHGMSAQALDILQVSTADVLGGAERIAFDLFRTYRSLGHQSHLAVGRKRTSDPDVILMRHDRGGSAWRRFWWGLHAQLQPCFSCTPGARTIARFLQRMAEPAGFLDVLRGVEEFEFPAAWRLLEMPHRTPDIVHCHNLHGKYFDLRALPTLSRRVPVMLTLHDAWLLAGHCAHSFDCERWKTGCGGCPDLKIYPAIRRDATASNLRRKAGIYAQSRLYVATPCQWLMDKVHQSVLGPAVIESRVIPNGIDLAIFKPGDRYRGRAILGLPATANVLLFAAFGVKRNTFKDYETLRRAAALLSKSRTSRNVKMGAPAAPLIVIALGEAGETEHLNGTEIRFIPHVNDPSIVAQYYQSADLYVHAARADTFPTSILEALACGTPVVATAVGGISEQFVPLDSSGSCATNSAMGCLVSAGDAESMARAIAQLLDDEPLRRKMGCLAAVHAVNHFDVRAQAIKYLDWYREILELSDSSESERNSHSHLSTIFACSS